MRVGVDAVQVRRDLLGIDNLVPDDSQLLGRHLGILHLVPDGDAEHVEVVTVIGVVHVREVGHLRGAGTAPGRPEIDQDILALADVIGELDGGCLGVLRVLDDGEVHEGSTFGRLALGLEESAHLGDLGDGVLDLVGKAVQKGDYILGIVHRLQLHDSKQADDVVGIELRGFPLVLVEIDHDLLVIGLGAFRVLPELRNLGTILGREISHPVVVVGPARLRSLLEGRLDRPLIRVDGDGGTVGNELQLGLSRLEDRERREVLREFRLETTVLDDDGRIQDIAHDNLHHLGGVTAELPHDLGGVAGLRCTGREQQRSGQTHQVCFHICLS